MRPAATAVTLRGRRSREIYSLYFDIHSLCRPFLSSSKENLFLFLLERDKIGIVDLLIADNKTVEPLKFVISPVKLFKIFISSTIISIV